MRGSPASGSGQPFPRACAGRGGFRSARGAERCFVLAVPPGSFGAPRGAVGAGGAPGAGRASQVGTGPGLARGRVPQGHCCRVLTVPVRENRRRAFTCLFRENWLGAMQKAKPTLFYLLRFLADLSSLCVHRATAVHFQSVCV